ncbi:MAG: methyl-accepting chemotaxis protein, partial [Spongiibacteraceae bacterium]
MKTLNQGRLSRLRANRTVSVLVAILVVGIIGAAINTYVVLRNAGYDQRYLELTSDIRIYAQQVANTSRAAALGDVSSFDGLKSAQGKFERVRYTLIKGKKDLPSPVDLLGRDIGELNRLSARINTASQAISANSDEIVRLYAVVESLHQAIPEIQEKYNRVIEIIVKDGAPAQQVAIAQRQTWLAERLARNIDRIVQGNAAATDAAEQFNVDASVFGTVLQGMLKGNKPLGIQRSTNPKVASLLMDIGGVYQNVMGSVQQVFESSPELLKSSDAAISIANDVPELMAVTSRLSAEIGNLDDKRPLSLVTVLLLVLLIIVMLVLLAWQALRNSQRRLQETASANEKNQAAILRLLDELADLADGDLTTSATVTEDFTGAIADSINYTIDQLRVLVSQINETTVKVSSAAQNSQSTALTLAEASESQAKEISGASAAISEMAVTIDKVSSNARESATVAHRSVEIANTGAQVVQNTIQGMDNIREQIQETSKRIKRLGESSQEIGDIVSLINDIADQTNILALNAAIQASMAGEAGRGFAVVADEVQRLAERSSGATKQIGALVKAIQSDTNEAVISMEQTTSEVVRGAHLAQDAGTALSEIEKVSEELSSLIQNISSTAEDQAKSAGRISST